MFSQTRLLHEAWHGAEASGTSNTRDRDALGQMERAAVRAENIQNWEALDDWIASNIQRAAVGRLGSAYR